MLPFLDDYLLVKKRSFAAFHRYWWLRHWWERHAIALTSACTHHIKNTCVVCCTSETLYGVLSHLLLTHSFIRLLITLFIITLMKCCYFTFNFLFTFFFHTVTFGFHVPVTSQTHLNICTRLYKCFFVCL